jgi:ribosomal protein S18 acetylase RimI-like enzyme
MSEYLITLIDSEKSEEEAFILKSLKEFNQSKVGDSRNKALTLAMKNQRGEIIAGLTGRTSRGWLFVENLWVHEEIRGKNIGTELLSSAENEARKRGCRFAHLDTFGFQALDFYKKQGYEIFGELQDYPEGYSRYFLKKFL